MNFPLLSLLFLLAEATRHLAKVELLAHDSLVDGQYVVAGALEVSSGVVRLGDKHLAALAVIQRLVQVTHRHELLLDGPEQIQAGLDLRVRIGRLHRGAHDGQEPAIRGHLMRVGHAADVDVRLSAHLILRYDQLTRKRVLGVGNGMRHDADGADHLADDLLARGRQVGGIADDELALGSLFTRAHARHAPLRVHDDLVHRLVEHVGAAVDGA